MTQTGCYKIYGNAVIYELMDNEVIIINLDLGHYYCLRGVAADIWTNLLNNFSQQKISQAIANHFHQPLENITDLMNKFIEELRLEKLITPQENVSSTEIVSAQPLFHAKTEFSHFLLEKYVDMKELLFLDPIHEVDEQGWPNQNPYLSEAISDQ